MRTTTPHIGVSTSAYSEVMLPAALERISEHATRAEIRSFGLHTLLSTRNRDEAQRAGLTYTVHGPFGSGGIWDPDETGRRAALDEHRRHLEAGAEIGARLYVVHPDWHPEARPRDPVVVTQLGRSFETLRRWQDDLGVEIVVENMPGLGMSHFTHPGDLDLCGLGLALDVGHASISGCLHDWLDGPGARLRHLHLHDNHGEGDHDDPHLALGQGVIDVAAVVQAAREAGASAVLEHYSERSVKTSLAHLRELGLL
ncbi:MAG: sugar phosphate isomerase/epimerase [Actinobacteria bacterium]|nr:sugar phosphate isomerase/epimerase [Actinomycetota bacterium]